MAKSSETLDWSLVQTFLAVAETGSLSQAARRLGLSQPTAGRQIRQIETRLELELFQRRPRGLALTEAGLALLPHARKMAEGMSGLGLAAAGRTERLGGPVRLTASVLVAHHHLPPILARLRAEEPDIQIDLVATDRLENLLYREADIAVRMHRSEQLDIVTRHLGDMPLGLYAAKSYIARRGAPETLDAYFRHDLVGFDRSDQILRRMRDMGLEAQRDWFATRTDQQAIYWELVRAGCGIGFVQCAVGDADPQVTRVLPDLRLPGLPLWLAAPEPVRQSPRIRRVWDALAEGLSGLVARRPSSGTRADIDGFPQSS